MGAGASLGMVVPEELLIEASANSPHVSGKHEQVKYSQETLQRVRRSSFNELRRKSKSSVKSLGPDVIPIYEVPKNVKELLTKIGIENNALHDTNNSMGLPQNRTTKLVSHIFECIQGLQHLVLADQSIINNAAQNFSVSAPIDAGLAPIDEGLSSEAAMEHNCSLLGQLIHEMVTIYGLCGNTLKVVLENTPESAAMEDIYGRLPLHVAVDTKHPWMGTIHTLLNAYPDALATKDGAGRLPLHIAVDQTTPSLDLIKLLVSKNSDAAKMTRGVGRLPIHYAVFPANMSVGIVDCLLDAYPLGAQCTDVYCKLPLHYAIDKANGTNVEVVQRLLVEYPKGALVRDTHNQTPLHIAIQRCTHGNLSAVALIQTLLAAIQLLDMKHDLPQLVLKFDLLPSLLSAPQPNIALIKYLCKLCPSCMLRSQTHPVSLNSGTGTGTGCMTPSPSTTRLSFGQNMNPIKPQSMYCNIIGYNVYDFETVAYRFSFSTEFGLSSPLHIALTKHDSVTCRVLLQALSPTKSELNVLNLIPLDDGFYDSDECNQHSGRVLPSRSHSTSSTVIVPMNALDCLRLKLNSHNYKRTRWLPGALSIGVLLRELNWEDRKYGVLLGIGIDIRKSAIATKLHSNSHSPVPGDGYSMDGNANSPSAIKVQINSPGNINNQNQLDLGVIRNTSVKTLSNDESRKVSDARLSLVDVEMLQRINSRGPAKLQMVEAADDDCDANSDSDSESSFSNSNVRASTKRKKYSQTLGNNLFRRVYLTDQRLWKNIVSYL